MDALHRWRALRAGWSAWRGELATALDELTEAVYPERCRLCGDAASRETRVSEDEQDAVGAFLARVAGAADPIACAAHALPFGLPGARCGRCAAALPDGLPDGYRCAACRRASPGFRALIALGEYKDPALRDWVLALKHGGRRDLARPLGARLGARWRAVGAARRGTVLVPVPLHALRRLSRGFDQALWLARAVAEAEAAPLAPVLRRVRATAVQGALGAPDRALNVRAAFGARRGGAEAVAGRDAWLVDDVVTSGSTARECARVLRSLGARSVAVLALARAGDARAERVAGDGA